jgi:hypothetical protein
MRALVTGGTGLLGEALLASLSDATVTSRNPGRARFAPGTRVLRWDPASEAAPAAAFDGVDVVFNLAGEPVAAGRWNAERKQRIRDSRVVGTRNLVAGMAALERRPAVLVSASAVGYYGDRGDEELDESACCGDDFLAEVCVAWEREAMEATGLGIRVACVRIGIVLSSRGGALERMLTPFRFGLGGPLGSGRQWMSWVHIDDVVGLLLHASDTPHVTGAINAVAPAPVRNSELTLALGSVLRRPAVLPVPELALRTLFGELSGTLLASQRVLPNVAEQTGYSFRYTELGAALHAIF